MYDESKVYALRKAARLFENAAAIMEASRSNDPMDYGDETVERVFAELEDICYDVGFLVGI